MSKYNVKKGMVDSFQSLRPQMRAAPGYISIKHRIDAVNSIVRDAVKSARPCPINKRQLLTVTVSQSICMFSGCLSLLNRPYSLNGSIRCMIENWINQSGPHRQLAANSSITLAHEMHVRFDF